MPIFGGVRSIYVRPAIVLTPLDQEIWTRLREGQARAEELTGRASLPLVRKSIERLRAAGKIKQLAHGKWTAQGGQDAGSDAAGTPKRLRRSYAA